MKVYNLIITRWSDGYGPVGDAPNRHVVALERAPFASSGRGDVEFHQRRAPDSEVMQLALVKRVTVPSDPRPREFTHVVIVEGVRESDELQPRLLFERTYGTALAELVDALCQQAAESTRTDGPQLFDRVWVRASAVLGVFASTARRPTASQPIEPGLARDEVSRTSTTPGGKEVAATSRMTSPAPSMPPPAEPAHLELPGASSARPRSPDPRTTVIRWRTVAMAALVSAVVGPAATLGTLYVLRDRLMPDLADRVAESLSRREVPARSAVPTSPEAAMGRWSKRDVSALSAWLHEVSRLLAKEDPADVSAMSAWMREVSKLLVEEKYDEVTTRLHDLLRVIEESASKAP